MTDKFSTPVSQMSRVLRSSTASKRDSLAAELERDPQSSTAKRQQRTQTFASHLAHASLERQLVAAQTARAELETRLREKEVLVERLEGDRRWLAERETEEREEKERERVEHAEEKCKADAEIRSLRAALLTLHEEHAGLTDEHASLSRSTTQTLSAHKSQISTLSRQTALLQDDLAEYKRIAVERARAIEDLQIRLEDASVANASFERRESDEATWAVVREELSRQAGYMRTLEAKNAKMGAELAALKERQASVEVLKEQKRDLERRAAGVEGMREKVVRLEAELDAARRERESWASDNSSSTPSKTPVGVTKSLADLRLSYARLLEQHGATSAMLKRRGVDLADAERRSVELQASVDALHADVRALQNEVGRKDNEKELVAREVSFLQAMLASYSAEESVHGGGRNNEQATQMVQHLEDLVADYKVTMQQLQKELDERGGEVVPKGGSVALKRLQEELETERASKERLQADLVESEKVAVEHEDKIENLEQTLFELRGEIGAGRHLPPGVRVLSLKENPAQQWADMSQSAMDRLRKENEALMRRLKELEESGLRVEGMTTGVEGESGEAQSMVPRESWEVVDREKTRLEGELKAKEKRLLRLQQIFQSKSAEFREAIASILGVKLAFYPNGQVRVTSQFDLNAAFVFQPTSSAGSGEGVGGMRMQLVAQGDGGPEDLPQLMRYWVEQEQCIPGFLASITLECYEKHKTEMERSRVGQ